MNESEKGESKEGEKLQTFSPKRGKIELILKFILNLFHFLFSIKILPLVITLVVIFNFFSKGVSTLFTWWILCVFLFDTLPTITKRTYGGFLKNWWVRIIIIVEMLIIYFFVGLSILQGLLSGLLLIVFFFVAALLFWIKIADQSNIEKWVGVAPQFWDAVLNVNAITDYMRTTEEITIIMNRLFNRSYNKFYGFASKISKKSFFREWFLGELGEPNEEYKFIEPPSKIPVGIRFIVTYIPAMFLSLLSFLLVFFVYIFSKSTMLLTIFLTGWVVYDTYKSISEKSISAFIKSIFGTDSIEKRVFHPLFSFEKPIAKKLISTIGILLSLIIISASYKWCFLHTAESFSNVHLSILIYPSFHPICYILFWYISMFLGFFQFSHFFIVFFETITVVYLLFFWYVVIKRYPYFIDIWNDRNFYRAVKAPFLSISCIIIFVIDFIVYSILAICGGINFPFSFLIGLLNIFGMRILIISVWNSKNKEISSKEIFKDNVYIPLLFSVSSLIPLIAYAYYHNNLLILVCGIIILILLILMFYADDWSCICEKKYSVNGTLKAKIMKASYVWFAFTIEIILLLFLYLYS